MTLPRVFISTDLRLSSEEKDDAQSLIHALLFQDRMDIVGISGTASIHGHQDGLVGDIDRIIDVYAKDQAKLEAHSAAFKSAAELKAVSWQGALDTAPWQGHSQATDASRAIIAEAKKAAAAGETLNVLTWGGETDLAQALHDDPSIAPHVRFFNISRQDTHAYNYVKDNFKGKLDLWVDDQSTFRGMYQTPDSSGIIRGWHESNADGHGALGSYFSDLSGDIFNVSGVKMGDSPTVLRFLSGNQDDPSAESWGGEFVKASDRYYVDNPDGSLDLGDRANTKGAMTIYEDRAAWLDSFAERLDWLKDGAPTPAGPAPVPTAPVPPKGPAPDAGSGTGDDVITVRVSGDAFRGGASFALTLDGRVIDGDSLVTASHAGGQWQVLTFRGDFVRDGASGHTVGVQFTNDLWQPGVGDRNLWVDEVRLNGVANGTDATLWSNGTATWSFPAAKPAPAAPAGANLLANGSFEASAVGVDRFADFGAVQGWTAIPGGRIELWNAHKGVGATDGDTFAELDHRGGRDGFHQDVGTVAGQAYALSFDLRARPGVAASTQGVEVVWNGKVVAVASPGADWGTFTVGVTGTGGRDRLTLREVGSQGGDGLGALIDDVSLVAAGPRQSGQGGTPQTGDDDDDDGVDVVTVRVSGQAYKGDPAFAVTVNGRVVDAETIVTADRADGEWQTFTFRGAFDLDGSDRVGITFLNDLCEGQGQERVLNDRNLFVDEVRVNGEANGANQDLYSAGTAHWDF